MDINGKPQATVWNLPNALCVIRLLGSPVLVVLAWLGQSTAFIALLIALIITDWIDGRLARWLKQQTALGARLDSFADAALFVAFLFGLGWLKGGFLLDNAGWIAAVVGSYLLTSLVGLARFRRVPSYHTWLAKFSNYFVSVGAILVLADWTPWPFRLSLVSVTITNLESTAISFVLVKWHADVASIFRALKLRRGDEQSNDAAAKRE